MVSKRIIFRLILSLSLLIFGSKKMFGSLNPGYFTLTDSVIDIGAKLDCSWQYVPGCFYTSDQMDSIAPTAKKFVTIPSRWNNHAVYKEHLDNFGIMTYYLKIITPAQYANSILGIKAYTINNAYQLFINDKLLLQDGNPTPTKQGFEGERKAQIAYFRADSDTIRVIVQVSNFAISNYAGISQPLIIGSSEAIEHINFIDNLEVVFYASAFLMIIVLQLIMYFIRKKDKSHLVLAIIGFMILLKILTENEHLLIVFFPEMTLNVEYRLWASTVLAIFLFFELSAINDPKEIALKHRRGNLYLASVIGLAIILLPLRILSNISVYFLPFALLDIFWLTILLRKTIIKKEPYAWIYFISYVIMSLFIINDLFYAADLLRIIMLSHIGGLFFLTLQTWLIVAKYSHSYNVELEWYKELENINSHLEKKVEQKTHEINFAAKQLELTTRKQERELTIFSAHIIKSDKLLFNIKKEIQNVLSYPDYGKEQILSVFDLFENQNEIVNTELNDNLFKDINTDFTINLRNRYPSLTNGEIKLCVFYRMGYTNKEISSLLIMNYEAVRKALSMIKKKIHVSKTKDLTKLLLEIEYSQVEYLIK